MAADISQVIRASAAQRSGLGVFEFLNVNFIIRGVAIVFYPEHRGAKEIIIFHQFYITNSMYFFSPADHFIRAMCVNIFNKVR